MCPTCSVSARCASGRPCSNSSSPTSRVEQAALERLGDGIALCLAKGDHGSRDLLESILTDEEEHVDWLETQLETINQIGIEHYLAQQLHSTSRRTRVA